MSGGVIVDDSGLCCCMPVQCLTSIVRAQLVPIFCVNLQKRSRPLSVSDYFCSVHELSNLKNESLTVLVPFAYFMY